MTSIKEETRLDSRSIPAIESADIKNSLVNFRMYLLGQKQADRGLESMETQEPQREEDEFQTREEYQWMMDKWFADKVIWENRRATAMSALFRATSVEPEVTEVRNLYMSDCKTNKKTPQAAELITILEERFTEKDESKLRLVQAKFDRLRVLPGENLEVAMTRMDQIVLELTDLGQPPTEATKILRLTRALNNGDDHLKHLVYTMASNANGNATTFSKLKATLKTFQNYLTDQKEEENSDPEPRVKSVNNLELGTPTCGYCYIRGHTTETCRKQVQDRAWYAKNAKSGGRGGKGKGGKGAGRGDYGKGSSNSGRGGKGGGKGKGGKGSSDKWIPTEGYSGCHNCGSKDHRKSECTSEPATKKSKWTGAKEVNMLTSGRETHLIQRQLTEEMIFLDSCCSSQMVIVKQVESMKPFFRYMLNAEDQQIQLSEVGKFMEISKVCSIGPFHHCFICPQACRNICSVSRLVVQGYGMTTDGTGTYVFNDHDKEVAVRCQTLHGMPYMPMREFVKLRPTRAAQTLSVDMLLRDPVQFDRENEEHLLPGQGQTPVVPCSLPSITVDTPEEEWPRGDQIGMAVARVTVVCNALKEEGLSVDRLNELQALKTQRLREVVALAQAWEVEDDVF